MRNVNKLLIGPPGVGKTATIKEQYDYTEILLLSSCTEDDISGLPYIDGGREMRAPPHWLERLRQASRGLGDGERACLFLDELDKARREVADTLLTLVVSPERYGLSDRVDIVAAANPPEWGGGDGVSRPMMSRFSIVRFTPDVQAVCAYLERTYPEAKKFIDDLRSGDVPIFDHAGEGYDARISCPRTIEMALQAQRSGCGPEVISGLLTANVAHAFMISCAPPAAGDTRAQHRVFARAREVHKKRTPVAIDP
jgi:MoxR-like ATPase